MSVRQALLVAGVLFLAGAAPSAGQNRSEVAAGVQFGVGPQPPITRGWILSTGFEIDQQDFVVEGAWHRRLSSDSLNFGDTPAEQGRSTYRSRFLTLAAGVRSRDSGGLIAPFYQVLLGGFQAVYRTDYEWPESVDADAVNARCGIWAGTVGDLGEHVSACLNVPYPEFREQREVGFLMQPGAGLNVRAGDRLRFRVLTDLIVFANREYVALRPRLSARVVVAFGR